MAIVEGLRRTAPALMLAGFVVALAAAAASASQSSVHVVALGATVPAAQDSAVVRARPVHSPASCVVAVAAGGAAQSPRRIAYRTPMSADELAANLQCLLAGSVRGGRWGIMAVSLTRGDTIFASDEGEHFLPASTQKLFTAALAFDQLGPDHHFLTSVLANGEVDSAGVLHGDLVLHGGGDPAFSNKFLTAEDTAPVIRLADLVRASGISSVTGSLIADPSAFDSQLVPDGWLSRYRDAGYAARVSALSLNENIASVVIAPGEQSESTLAALDPPNETMTVQSTVRTLPGRAGSSIAVRKLNDLTFAASGWIGDRAEPRRVNVVVEDPANFTAGAFRAALNSFGVPILGATVVAPAPTMARTLVAIPSPPLSRLVTAMNRESINHYAELIFRNAGRGADALLPGSAETANFRLTDFLGTKVGTDHGAVFAVDGSGLSVLNRVTPRSLIQLLDHSHRAPWGHVFHGSLPVAGESATLRTRMRNTLAHGNLHAKTGTTSEVIALSGYVTAENGEVLAFAFLYNGRDLDRARSTIDLMGPALASLSRR